MTTLYTAHATSTAGREGTAVTDDNGFTISAVLNISLPDIEKSEAEKIVAEAHEMCPYSKAIRGNVDVQLKVNSQPLAKAA